MIAIFDEMKGSLEQVVEDLDGIDLSGKGTTAAPDNWEKTCEWDETGRAFVAGKFEAERETAKHQIDALAEAIYANIGKAGLVGSVIHPAKYAEAAQYLAADNPVDTDYPLLLAETGITAATLHDVANIVAAKPLETRDKILCAAMIIEPLRLSARNAIDAATNLPEITAVVETLNFPQIP